MKPRRPPDAAAATLDLAHALRTPLTSLSLGLGLLDEGALGPLTASQRDVVRALVADAARLAVLVDGELQTDRLGLYAGPIDRVDVDLGDLLSAAALPITAQAEEKGVRLVSTLAPGVNVVADPVKLGWVATSLLGSALRHSPAGATIDLELCERVGEASFTVRDHGPGLTAQAAAQIFDREGGRGLFLAREIIDAHGGSIAVRSTEGLGSVFEVRLPAARRSRRNGQEG
ncbi:MAG: HAMP domain-containing sensor histidine kinase [Byssovorax sp.]